MNKTSHDITDGEEMVVRFFDWINERHAIYLDRQDGEAFPWTDDPILQEYKFTNVFRELDTVTKWLRKTWREPFADHSRLYFNIAMARQFNWPKTLERIGYVMGGAELYEYTEYADDMDLLISEWDPQALTDVVEEYQNAGNKVFTGAYMIRGQCVNPSGVKWTSKAQYMFHNVMDPVWNAPEPDWQSMTLREAVDWWQQFEGFGPFLSYEIVTDMRHTRYLRNAADIMTWANPGPGAMRGLNRIHGWGVGLTGEEYIATNGNTSNKRYPVQQQKPDMYVFDMQSLLEISPEYLEEHVPALELREIEHSLCEFDKYERVRNNQGRPRSKYTPPQV